MSRILEDEIAAEGMNAQYKMIMYLLIVAWVPIFLMLFYLLFCCFCFKLQEKTVDVDIKPSMTDDSSKDAVADHGRAIRMTK